MPATPLCTAIAINIPIVLTKVVHRPRARPSKNEWTDKAIIITKGVVFIEQHPFLGLVMGSSSRSVSNNTSS
jgi:hypothetical protein